MVRRVEQSERRLVCRLRAAVRDSGNEPLPGRPGNRSVRRILRIGELGREGHCSGPDYRERGSSITLAGTHAPLVRVSEDRALQGFREFGRSHQLRLPIVTSPSPLREVNERPKARGIKFIDRVNLSRRSQQSTVEGSTSRRLRRGSTQPSFHLAGESLYRTCDFPFRRLVRYSDRSHNPV